MTSMQSTILLIPVYTYHYLQNPYFYAGVQEMRITCLAALKQRTDESVSEFVQRFRDVRSQCYGLKLSEAQFADLVSGSSSVKGANGFPKT